MFASAEKPAYISAMQAPAINSLPIKFAILVFPGFPMMAFSSVIEPLRAANAISAARLYEWVIVSAEGAPLSASNGIVIAPDYSPLNAPLANYIVVCSGGDADRISAEAPLNWIRKSLRNGAHIGSVADGAFYLGRAGLLDGRAQTASFSAGRHSGDSVVQACKQHLLTYVPIMF